LSPGAPGPAIRAPALHRPWSDRDRPSLPPEGRMNKRQPSSEKEKAWQAQAGWAAFLCPADVRAPARLAVGNRPHRAPCDGPGFGPGRNQADGGGQACRAKAPVPASPAAVPGPTGLFRRRGIVGWTMTSNCLWGLPHEACMAQFVRAITMWGERRNIGGISLCPRKAFLDLPSAPTSRPDFPWNVLAFSNRATACFPPRPCAASSKGGTAGRTRIDLGGSVVRNLGGWMARGARAVRPKHLRTPAAGLRPKLGTPARWSFAGLINDGPRAPGINLRAFSVRGPPDEERSKDDRPGAQIGERGSHSPFPEAASQGPRLPGGRQGEGGRLLPHFRPAGPEPKQQRASDWPAAPRPWVVVCGRPAVAVGGPVGPRPRRTKDPRFRSEKLAIRPLCPKPFRRTRD